MITHDQSSDLRVRNNEIKPAVVFDFDGTITDIDVFDSLFAEFADPAWLDAHRAYHEDECGLEEAYHRMVVHFRAAWRDVADFLDRRIGLREGFRELTAELREKRVRTLIVSNGFDLYIDYLLDRWGIERDDFEIICHHARIEGDRFVPSFRRHSELEHAHCLIGKAEIVSRLKSEGYSVAFCGDGYSDTPASRVADLVFARGDLARFCRKNGIAFRYLDDFFTVRERLRILNY